jgi:hypothetical protein
MRPHPDFAERGPPMEAVIGQWRLCPLGPAAVEEDFAAVTRSCAVLRGFFGNDWPVGLTLEEDRIDLAWHAREFAFGRSFAWIVRDGDGTYAGCAYVFPALGKTGAGEVFVWVVDRPDRRDILTELKPILAAWLRQWLPPGGGYDWQMNDRI